ncbi:MAG TPA: imelysin family protein [Paracoccaceae bacterium]
MSRIFPGRWALVAAGCLAALPAFPDTAADEQRGLANVRQFTLDHNARLIGRARLLEQAAGGYHAIIAGHGGDYAAAWAAEGPALAGAVGQLRDLWLESSNQYETIEGIVAGIPETAKYDLILDAGNPGGEAEDVAEYDLTLPDGSVLARPGNLFHGITEPLLWGMDPAHVKLEADLDGDGRITRGEMLPDANLALGAAQALTHWAQALGADMTAWVPNRDDAFTAVVTMTPTVGDYFGEWKESQFITGEIGAFVAQSRLVDVQGIMGGCKTMYFNAISPVVAAADPELDARVRAGFDELLALVEDTYAREQAGSPFSAEEADALGNEAQDIADRIVALVLQAAARLDVKIHT